MTTAKAGGTRKGKDDYKPFSQLTKVQRSEVLADPVYRKYAQRLKAEDWRFMKVSAGWVTKQ